MFRSILSTSGTLGIISIINLAVVLLISNTLGKAGVTEMGLIVLGISFVVMLNNIIGGASLVYMVPRAIITNLVCVSYIWALLSACFMTLVLWFFELVPSEYVIHVGILGFIESIFSINIQVLLGRKKIHLHNAIKLIQKVSLLLAFIVLGITIDNFVLALFISFGVTLLISLYFLSKEIKAYLIDKPLASFKQLFNYGIQIQSSNILQLLNYRLIYVFIEKTMGDVLGIYIVAVQLAESLWIPSKALAIIQYSVVSNEKNEEKRKQVSASFLKLTFLLTLILLAILLLVPEEFIGWIFGKDFDGLGVILLSLSVGVMAVAVNQIFSHYLSGKGIYKYNIVASAIGLTLVVSLGWFLIDSYKLVGAGVVTSIAYLGSTIYLAYIFFKKTNLPLSTMIPNKEDFVLFKEKVFNKKKE